MKQKTSKEIKDDMDFIVKFSENQSYGDEINEKIKKNNQWSLLPNKIYLTILSFENVINSYNFNIQYCKFPKFMSLNKNYQVVSISIDEIKRSLCSSLKSLGMSKRDFNDASMISNIILLNIIEYLLENRFSDNKNNKINSKDNIHPDDSNIIINKSKSKSKSKSNSKSNGKLIDNAIVSTFDELFKYLFSLRINYHKFTEFLLNLIDKSIKQKWNNISDPIKKKFLDEFSKISLEKINRGKVPKKNKTIKNEEESDEEEVNTVDLSDKDQIRSEFTGEILDPAVLREDIIE